MQQEATYILVYSWGHRNFVTKKTNTCTSAQSPLLAIICFWNLPTFFHYPNAILCANSIVVSANYYYQFSHLCARPNVRNSEKIIFFSKIVLIFFRNCTKVEFVTFCTICNSRWMRGPNSFVFWSALWHFFEKKWIFQQVLSYNFESSFLRFSLTKLEFQALSVWKYSLGQNILTSRKLFDWNKTNEDRFCSWNTRNELLITCWRN